LALQKAMLDVFAAQKFEDLALSLEQLPASGDDDSKFQKWQTQNAVRHRFTFRTFKEVYAIELNGIADLHEERLQDFGRLLWAQGNRQILDGPAESPKSLTRDLTAVLIAGLKGGRLSVEIPSIHIHTSIHAAIRYKRQKFRKGDTWDFQHAATALGHCQAFFTDRRLANLLEAKPPSLDQQYRCKIFSDDQEIIEFLRGIGRSR
jgi:hypothetical protein